MMIEKMRLYYIAFRYSDDMLEMIDGPYGNRYEAFEQRNALCGKYEDEKLIVVRQQIDVKEFE